MRVVINVPSYLAYVFLQWFPNFRNIVVVDHEWLLALFISIMPKLPIATSSQ